MVFDIKSLEQEIHMQFPLLLQASSIPLTKSFHFSDPNPQRYLETFSSMK